MIWDREAETATAEDRLAQAAAAWQVQYRDLAQRSPFYARKLREADIGSAAVALADLHRLPFTSKQELKLAIDAAPPFGENLGVPPERVKRVYQTSGTTGSPSVIALSEADIESWTVIGSRSYHTTGIHTDSNVLSTYGAGPFVAGHTYLAFGRIGCRVVPVGPGDTERTLFALRAGIADILVGTPSFAQYLANRLESPAGSRVEAFPRSAITSSECWAPPSTKRWASATWRPRSSANAFGSKACTSPAPATSGRSLSTPTPRS